MAHSGSNQPDLDWSQVRETVKLLTVSVAQVQNSMQQGDESVNTLTESFTSMVHHMGAIEQILQNLDAEKDKQDALEYCQATSDLIQSSIMAFQFYDRLQQCLDHVATSLVGLSELVEEPQRLYNPAEWKKFQDEIRGRYTMESEKAMFDAILQGKSLEEALALVNETEDQEEEDIELF